MVRRIMWNGIDAPDDWCGQHEFEQNNDTGGENHVCSEKPGHKGKHKCHCDYEFEKGDPVLIKE